MHYKKPNVGPMSILVYLGIIAFGLYYTKYSNGNTLIDCLVALAVMAVVCLIGALIKRADKNNNK